MKIYWIFVTSVWDLHKSALLMTTTTLFLACLAAMQTQTHTHAKNAQAHKYCQIAAITLPKWLSEHLYSLLLFFFCSKKWRKQSVERELNICCGAPNNSVSIVYVHVYLQNESIIVRETMNDRCYDREKHREKPTNQQNNKAHTMSYRETERDRPKTRVRYGFECASLLACWLAGWYKRNHCINPHFSCR